MVITVVSPEPKMQHVDRFGHGLHRIIYISHSTQLLSGEKRSEIEQIVDQSNVRNASRALTGALLVYGDWFVQVLEGDHASLETLFRKIEADQRHHRVTLKGVEAIEHRMFGRWGMREGRVPTDAEEVDLGALDYRQLLTMLRLSTKAFTRRAA